MVKLEGSVEELLTMFASLVPECANTYNCANSPPVASDLWWKKECEGCRFKNVPTLYISRQKGKMILSSTSSIRLVIDGVEKGTLKDVEEWEIGVDERK